MDFDFGKNKTSLLSKRIWYNHKLHIPVSLFFASNFYVSSFNKNYELKYSYITKIEFCLCKTKYLKCSTFSGKENQSVWQYLLELFGVDYHSSFTYFISLIYVILIMTFLKQKTPLKIFTN